MKVSLLVADGVNKGKVIPITKPQFLVGRDASCHLRPASPSVSKRHCALLVKQGKMFVRDLTSTNGTFVNDQPVTGELEVQNGDKLVIGPLNLVIRIERRVPVDAPTPLPGSKPKSRAKTIDEDSVADMLLELDEHEASTLDGLIVDDSPAGTTLFDAPAPMPATEEPGPDQAPGAPSKYEAAQAAKADTSAAAKEILQRYSRRSR